MTSYKSNETFPTTCMCKHTIPLRNYQPFFSSEENAVAFILPTNAMEGAWQIANSLLWTQPKIQLNPLRICSLRLYAKRKCCGFLSFQRMPLRERGRLPTPYFGLNKNSTDSTTHMPPRPLCQKEDAVAFYSFTDRHGGSVADCPFPTLDKKRR
jgi:hypothetical protein